MPVSVLVRQADVDTIDTSAVGADTGPTPVRPQDTRSFRPRFSIDKAAPSHHCVPVPIPRLDLNQNSIEVRSLPGHASIVTSVELNGGVGVARQSTLR